MRVKGIINKRAAGKLLAAVTAAGVLMGSLGGMPVMAEETEGTAMGRYVESDVALPEGSERMVILDLEALEDGRLRMMGSDQEGNALWDSSDGGVTWEKTALPEEYKDIYFTSAALFPDGSGGGITYSQGDSGEYVTEYIHIDADGNAQKGADLSESIVAGRLEASRSGVMLGLGSGGDLFSLDPVSGEVINTFSGAEAQCVGTSGDQAMVMKKSFQIQWFDMGSGEPLGRDETLEAALYDGEFSYEINTSFGAPIVFTEDGEGRIYYSTSKGIFTYLPGGSAVEQVVDGSMNTLSDPSNTKVALAAVDNCFYLAYIGGNAGGGIWKYQYDETVSSSPQTELKIYSLRENAGVRQVAVMFQKQYPDVYVNYQVGLTGEDGMTASDALRTLNTDIMAGNGPDVLILDGMSVDTYAEQGMLMDIGGILQEVEAEEGLLENIAYTYQNGDSVPAVPTRFAIPVLAGTGEALEQVDSLETLAAAAGEEGMLGTVDAAMSLNTLYMVCAGSWKQEDNTLNREKLTEYIQTVCEIYDNFKAIASDSQLELLQMFMDMDAIVQDTAELMSDQMLSVADLELLSGRQQLSAGILIDMMDYSGVSSVNRVNGNCGIKLWKGQQEQVYVPICTVGVLNTAKAQETAAAFVKYMLTAEGETANGYAGFPVNQAAFETTVYEKKYEDGEYSAGASSADGTYEEIDYYWPTQEELDWLIQAVSGLNQAADVNSIQEAVVKEETLRCMTGEISVEEAVNSIMQKINLYLAE